MLTYIFGIYGYGFTSEMSLAGFQITPLYHDHQSIKGKFDDKKIFHLTGYGTFEGEFLFNRLREKAMEVKLLADGMSFCEQQWVLPSLLIELPKSQSPREFIDAGKIQPEIDLYQTRHRHGSVIKHDWWKPESRKIFIEQLISKLKDREFVDGSGFDKAFYRSIEVLKMRTLFVDITHYMHFSAIELLARHDANVYNRNAGLVVSEFLQKLGFSTTQREWERWFQYRNALFHQGKLEGHFDGESVTLHDLPLLDILLADILIKLVGFDDNTIHWNRWKDRMSWSG